MTLKTIIVILVTYGPRERGSKLSARISQQLVRNRVCKQCDLREELQQESGMCSYYFGVVPEFH